MTTRSVRVTVRGAFDGLSPGQRAELQSDAAAHDVMHASYTPDGHLSYDVAARPFFTFRFLTSAADHDGIPAAAAAAEATATAWLDERGYGYKGLAVTTDDLSEAPLGARQRKAAARKDR
jgi:hypothetical protein